MRNLSDAARDMKGIHGRDGSLKCGVRNDAVRLAGVNQPNLGRKCSGWTSELSGNRPRCLSLFFLHLGLPDRPAPRYAHTTSFLVHSPKVQHRLKNVPVYRITWSGLVSQRDSGVPKPGIPPILKRRLTAQDSQGPNVPNSLISLEPPSFCRPFHFLNNLMLTHGSVPF